MSLDTDLLQDLAKAERDEVQALVRPHQHPDGSIVFRQGSPADTALRIAQGQVRLLLELPGEDSIEVARVGTGAWFGELALLRPRPRSLTAVAHGPVTLEALEARDFQGLRHAMRPASFRIMLTIARRMAEMVAHADARTRRDEPTVPFVAFGQPPLGAQEQPGCSFDPRPFLDRLPFFSRFSPPDQDALLRLGTLWQLPRGRALVAEGTEALGMFIVLRGAVEVLSRPDTPRLALIGPGGLVGQLSPLLDRPPIASCQMREAGTVLQLGPEALQTLLSPSRRLSYRFLDGLCQGLLDDVARADRVLARVESARSRLAREG